MRNPHLRILAEDAVDRRRLRPHRQDAPPPACESQRGGAAKQRVEWCDLEVDEVAYDREYVRPPASPFLARQHDIMDAVRSD